MKIRKFGNIYQLAFLPIVFPINCYLVDEGPDLTLIDTGMAFCAKGILKAVNQLHKPLTRIALTHPHVDHIGALDTVKQAFPAVEVYVSTRDARLMAGDFKLLRSEDQTEIKGGFNHNVQTKPDELLITSSQLKSLTVYSAPGHTPGSIAFYQKSSGILLTGDAMVSRGGLAVAGDQHRLFPFSAAATWSPVTAIKSMKHLNQLPIHYLMVGHGRVVKEANQKIARAIKRAEQRLN
ncbi:MAG TPA: MBL fold metallo-hydrolase [Candidatus Levilactobacillus faecigallinarum]|uniref:MBL fold metallo-hydrolase n=1 Tax=Candidatus Levilactobacillus faecigallinarum TaxID=2838638 RepID=A0A9D1QSG5_9LACO|nr:MBL fold metallo-hydrolase [Candidatus Levilactobacillus faecigallinarum]